MTIFPPGTGGFLNPKNIVESFVFLEPQMKVADFGCGHGYFVIPLAQKLTEGKVFALDILPSALEAVKSKARMEGLQNIEYLRCDLEKKAKLEDESCDVVLIANLLFQVENKENVIQEAKRVTKKGGRIICIEWLPNLPFSPQNAVSPQKAKELFLKHNLTLEKEFATDRYHYGLIFKK